MKGLFAACPEFITAKDPTRLYRGGCRDTCGCIAWLVCVAVARLEGVSGLNHADMKAGQGVRGNQLI